MVPRWAHNPKAAGSTPASATKNGAVAQLGEHLPCKQRVASSILAGSTIRFLNSVAECLPDLQEVAGSSPAESTKIKIIYFAGIIQSVEC